MSWVSLQIGLTGTNAARRAMELVSENVANVNTEGYTRRRIDLAAAASSGSMNGQMNGPQTPTGVQVLGVTRMRDAVLDNAYRAQAAAAGSAEMRAEIAARAEEILGPLDGGAQVALGEFWTAWEKLASNPSDLASRAGVISAGERVATSLRGAAEQLSSMQKLITDRGSAVVRQINTYASQIAQLNGQIGDATFRGAAANELLDQRDVLLDKLSKLITVSTRTDQGMTSVFVGSFPLVTGMSSNEMEEGAGGTPVWSATGTPVELGGELAAIREAVNLTLPGIETSLDEIASVLISVVNTQHQAGTNLDGASGGVFFSGTTAADIRVTSSLTPRGVAAGTTGSPSDNRNALAIAALGSYQVPGVGAVDDLMANLAGQLGESAASTEQMARVFSSSLSSVDDQRQSQMGVNLDEEFGDLIRYQRAYEASARVMQIADEMLDKLINGTGV